MARQVKERETRNFRDTVKRLAWHLSRAESRDVLEPLPAGVALCVVELHVHRERHPVHVARLGDGWCVDVGVRVLTVECLDGVQGVGCREFSPFSQPPR
jgi:hypothetical protein